MNTTENKNTPWYIDPDHKGIVRFDNEPLSGILAGTKAQLIVTAVNNYSQLVEALKIALWAEENGEYEAQKQGKPRLMERLELYRNLLSKIEKP